MLEKEPAAAVELFGQRIALARNYAGYLADEGMRIGLLGPREPERLWSRHLLNSALLARFIQPGRRVADIGSGAGLPGLVLAICCPDNEFTLIDSMQRRTAWLEKMTSLLGLDNVTVICDRAENVDQRFDQITARALGPLKRILPWVCPLLDQEGELLLLKGAAVDEEIVQAQQLILRYNLTGVKVMSAHLEEHQISVFRAVKVSRETISNRKGWL